MRPTGRGWIVAGWLSAVGLAAAPAVAFAGDSGGWGQSDHGSSWDHGGDHDGGDHGGGDHEGGDHDDGGHDGGDHDGGGHHGHPHVLVVDDDHVQCPQAQFTAIEAAVLAAAPGDTIHVCPGLYAESVTVDKPLTLDGAGPTPDMRVGDPGVEAVVSPLGEGFVLAASRVEIDGFSIVGNDASAIGIHVLPTATGETIRGNYLIELPTAIAWEEGTVPRQRSSISQNLLIEDLTGISFDGPFHTATGAAKLTVDHNTFTSSQDAIVLRRMSGVVICQNRFFKSLTGVREMGSTANEISFNSLQGGFGTDTGIYIRHSDHDLVLGNEIGFNGRGFNTAGIWLDEADHEVVTGNFSHLNPGDGVLLTGATFNFVFLNRADQNTRDGIHLTDGASDNHLSFNSMHGNAVFDAEDWNRPANDWDHNHCDTDSPPGTICTH